MSEGKLKEIYSIKPMIEEVPDENGDADIFSPQQTTDDKPRESA